MSQYAFYRFFQLQLVAFYIFFSDLVKYENEATKEKPHLGLSFRNQQRCMKNCSIQFLLRPKISLSVPQMQLFFLKETKDIG